MDTQSTQMTAEDARIINDNRDAARGYVAVSACAAGWAPELSVEMGRIAEPAITARLIAGTGAAEAIREAIAEVEVMAAMEVFASAMSRGAAPEEAFEAVADVKRKGMSDMPGFEEALTAARHNFAEALMRGMTPYAALIAGDIAAAAAARLVSRSVN